MTIKGHLHKQIIISMGKDNANKFMASASNYIANINRAFKNIKLDVLADYVQQKSTSVTIITNKVASPSDLQTIENIVENMENINSEDIKSPKLLQSKSYLKIIGIPFFIENTNVPIMSDYVEEIIKSNHIFNNLLLASKLQVIKALSKSDMAIIWVDIWNAQSGFKAKNLINKSFNVRNHIVTIYSANINPSVPQCKNCWKWRHSTFLYYAQGSKCVKCNRPYKSRHNWHFIWCYKVL